MTQVAIRQLIADGIATALEAQAAIMANTNRNVISVLKRIWNRYIFSLSKYAQEDKVTFATGTLTDDALSWLLTNKYYPRTEVKKIEDGFYYLAVKGNDLKTYVRRFQELAVLYPNMVPNTEKLMEVFIGGLPRSIEGNVTASKPQTLEEAITITQRLMEQFLNLRSLIFFYSDAEDFGPTTEKDGQDCSCNVEQRVPEMITGMESYQEKAVQYWDHISIIVYLRDTGRNPPHSSTKPNEFWLLHNVLAWQTCHHLSRLRLQLYEQVHMYLRGSRKAGEMKHDAAISAMMAAFRQAMNNGHRNCASHIGAQI
ncbi:hypothetical protein Tco_0780766 [Tanacetum coccineum]